MILQRRQKSLRAIPEKNTWEGKTAGNVFFYGSLQIIWVKKKTKKLFVAFPWVETSTGPGGFMICVFIIYMSHFFFCGFSMGRKPVLGREGYIWVIGVITFCGFSMGRNQYWAGRVYDLCLLYDETPEGST